MLLISNLPSRVFYCNFFLMWWLEFNNIRILYPQTHTSIHPATPSIYSFNHVLHPYFHPSIHPPSICSFTHSSIHSSIQPLPPAILPSIHPFIHLSAQYLGNLCSTHFCISWPAVTENAHPQVRQTTWWVHRVPVLRTQWCCHSARLWSARSGGHSVTECSATVLKHS